MVSSDKSVDKVGKAVAIVVVAFVGLIAASLGIWALVWIWGMIL